MATQSISSRVEGFPHSSVGKESFCNAGDPSLTPGSGRSPGEGKGYPLHYSWASLVAQLVKNLPATWETWVQSLGCEDPLEKGRLPTPVFWPGEFHGVAKSRTRLNNFIFTVNRGFRKMMLLQKFEINFYSIISHSFHVIQ